MVADKEPCWYSNDGWFLVVEKVVTWSIIVRNNAVDDPSLEALKWKLDGPPKPMLQLVLKVRAWIRTALSGRVYNFSSQERNPCKSLKTKRELWLSIGWIWDLRGKLTWCGSLLPQSYPPKHLLQAREGAWGEIAGFWERPHEFTQEQGLSFRCEQVLLYLETSPDACT